MSAAISLANLTKLADVELVQTAVAGREASFEELVRRVRAMRIATDAPTVEMPNAFVFGLREATLELEAV